MGTEEKRGTTFRSSTDNNNNNNNNNKNYYYYYYYLLQLGCNPVAVKFLRHLLGITKLDKEKINVLGKKLEHRT